jgi:hypothetical protein
VSFEIFSLKQARYSCADDDGDRPSLPWHPVIHFEVFRATVDADIAPSALLAVRGLTETLAHLAVTRPDVLARERWLRVADALPLAWRKRADALARRKWGALDATCAPLALVEVLENEGTTC